MANSGDADIGVLLNAGDGTFAAASRYPTGLYPNPAVAADPKGDGKLDLAVPISDGTISVFMNT